MADPDVAIEHPNREKASSKATRAAVIVLLLASAFLMIVISVGAWDVLVGAKALQVLLIAFAMRGFQQAWNVEVEHPVEPPRRGEPATA